MVYKTITIKDKVYNLPKNMPLPRKGERVIIGPNSGIVSSVTYQFEADSSQAYFITILTI